MAPSYDDDLYDGDLIDAAFGHHIQSLARA
jgi:hypothetical protein